MGKFYETLTPALTEFIAAQKLFFTATAPNAGRINLSPKGMDTFRCIDEHTVAYLDLTGSGSETSAHLLENGRITLMFCSFGAKPNILRLYGRGLRILPKDPEWSAWQSQFPESPGARQIIVVEVESAQTSCGFAVPRYEFLGERGELEAWAQKKGTDGIRAYQEKNNRQSIDGLDTGLFEHS